MTNDAPLLVDLPNPANDSRTDGTSEPANRYYTSIRPSVNKSTRALTSVRGKGQMTQPGAVNVNPSFS